MEKIKALTDEIAVSSDTGRLLLATLDQLHLELGTGRGLMEDWDTFGKLATDTVISKTWEFIHKNDLTVHERCPTISLRRANDRCLMPLFAKVANKKDLAATNRCRLYLQVTTMADITTGDGLALIELALVGRRGDDERPDYYAWPYQVCPPTKDWNCWKRGLAEPQEFEQPKLRPQFQLGPWTDDQRDKWNWFFLEPTRRLYRRTRNGFQVFCSLRRRSTRSAASTFTFLREQPDLPAPARRTVAVPAGPHQWKHTGTSEEETAMTNTPRTLQQRIDQLPASAKWALPNIHYGIGTPEDDGLGAANLIRSGDAIAISDGSFKEKWGTSAFRIPSWRRGIYKMGGCNVVAGEDDDRCAYCSEAARLYAMVTLVEVLCTHHNVEEGEITVGCDGKGPLLQCLWVDSKATHFDILMAVRAKIKRSPIKFKHHHVSGHQDRDKDYKDLDRWEQLNAIMDKRAKQYWNRTHRHRDAYRYRGEIQDAPWGVYTVHGGSQGCILSRRHPSLLPGDTEDNTVLDQATA